MIWIYYFTIKRFIPIIELRIPHEGIMNRDFVIVPLSEIAPDFIIPEKGIKASEIDLNKIEKNIISKTDYKL